MKQKLLILGLVLFSQSVLAATQMANNRMSDIRNTKHNFAANDSTVELPGGVERDVKAVSENQICVFCHTPHGKPSDAVGDRLFLWNRKTTDSGYTRYDSSSSDHVVGVLGQGSKMCLSCHDGTVAPIGELAVLNGEMDPAAISMMGSNVTGTGLLTGDTNLGVDLSNDHPVGFTYNATLATTDGELIQPGFGLQGDEGAHIGVPVGRGLAQNNSIVSGSSAAGSTPATTTSTDDTSGASPTSDAISVPLEAVVSGLGNKADPTSLALVSQASEGSVECTTCHDPHIRASDNSENIKFLRLHRFQQVLSTGGSFAINSDINCLACHKKEDWATSVHAVSTADYDDTVAESREFQIIGAAQSTKVWEASCLNCHAPHTDSGARWLLREATDGSGNSEIENTCFQCHTTDTSSVLKGTNTAKDIETANLLGGKHTASDFDSATNLHNITNADFQEEQANIKNNRHVTCSDCHNPHRIVKTTLNSGAISSSALHEHTDGVVHTNLIPGALSGVSGVEPDFTNEPSFNPHSNASQITFVEKFGAAGTADATTKEYQVCLKCHSNWGIEETDITKMGSNVTNLLAKSNTAADFGKFAVSYHPVINETNNDGSDFGGGENKSIQSKVDSSNFLAPFSNIGSQTMLCSDCHNSNVPGAADVNVLAQGPHGQSNLVSASGNDLCVDCHDPAQYQTANTAPQNSGFSCVDDTSGCAKAVTAGNANNLHAFHAGPTGTGADNVCTDCHVKIPHGWRNKALLVDLDEGDTEALKDRYYPDGKQTILTFDDSGSWKHNSCGAGTGTGGCH